MSKNFKIVGIILIILIVGFFVINLDNIFEEEDEIIISYVDVSRIFNNHPGKEEAEKFLNKTAYEMQIELEQTINELDEEQQQDKIIEYQKKLSQKEEELINNIMEDIDYSIKKIATEKGHNLVLKREEVILGGYDLTQEIIDYIIE